MKQLNTNREPVCVDEEREASPTHADVMEEVRGGVGSAECRLLHSRHLSTGQHSHPSSLQPAFPVQC